MSDENLLGQVAGFPLRWCWDVKNSSMTCSEQLPKLLGYPTEKTLTLAQILASAHAEQRDMLKVLVREVYQKHLTREVRVTISTEQQRFVALLCIWHDVNEPHLIQGTIEVLINIPSEQIEFELLHHLFVKAHVGMLVLDSKQRILMANQEFCRSTGFDANELLGISAELFGGSDADPHMYQRIWLTVDKKGFWSGELLARDKQGLTFVHELTLQRIQVRSEKNFFYVAISKRLDAAMTRIESEQENSEDLMAPDSSSKLLAVAEFKQKLNKNFTQLPGDRTMVLVVFQPYFSKNISTSMSHWLIGNRLLNLPHEMEIGVLSQELFAGFFIVPRNLGVIHQQLQVLMNAICKDDEQLGEINDIDIKVSLGISILGTDAISTTQMISHASQALVGSRERGVSSIIYFDNRLQKKMDSKQVLSRLLDKAISANQIDVFYQPIIDLRTLKITKFEALFRVNLDTKLPYNTQELIQLAEENGWIDRIDLAVTRKGLIDLLAIQEHFKDPSIQLSVNRSMRNDRLSHCCLEDTLQVIMDARIDPKLVTVELTESSFLADVDRQMVWIERLKKEGIEIAIDDFGTGYSSFSYLLNLPISLIKIDRSFVMDLKMGSNAYMMIQMVTSLVHRMGGKVVAEGVETTEVLHMLSLARVDYAQGYLFSKPMSLNNIVGSKLPHNFTRHQSVLSVSEVRCARDIMLREFPRVSLDHKLGTVLEMMRNHQHNFWVVIEEGQCRGILRDAEVNAAISPYLETDAEQKRDVLTLNRRVHQILKKGGYESLSQNSEVDIIKRAFQNPETHLVVVTGDTGGCVGIITPDILFQNL